jgi:hypothetical protein
MQIGLAWFWKIRDWGGLEGDKIYIIKMDLSSYGPVIRPLAG